MIKYKINYTLTLKSLFAETPKKKMLEHYQHDGAVVKNRK